MVQRLFYYYVNCLQNSPWRGSVMATYGRYESPQALREFARHSGMGGVPGGGWHYSFMGGAERIKQKVENIAESHMIIDKVGTVAEIESKMKSQTDLWNRTDQYAQKHIVDITIHGMAPKCINEFLAKYPDFVFRGA
jgi:beta-1,4-mannosyl-glycoprotein beta-1,4-N-acetylglucosaminyltransferase